MERVPVNQTHRAMFPSLKLMVGEHNESNVMTVWMMTLWKKINPQGWPSFQLTVVDMYLLRFFPTRGVAGHFRLVLIFETSLSVALNLKCVLENSVLQRMSWYVKHFSLTVKFPSNRRNSQVDASKVDGEVQVISNNQTKSTETNLNLVAY